MTNAENQIYYEEWPALNDIEIQFNYPNVTIDQYLTIPMTDFKQLLIEWLDFINENSNQNNDVIV